LDSDFWWYEHNGFDLEVELGLHVEIAGIQILHVVHLGTWGTIDEIWIL